MSAIEGLSASLARLAETQDRLRFEAMRALDSLAELEASFERMRRLAQAIRVELRWVTSDDGDDGHVGTHTHALLGGRLAEALCLVADESQGGR